MTANAKLKGEELTKAAAKQPWDPSVQALVAFPDALKLLDENLQWTTELGNAFLDQQAEVMAAVQRMRKKAQDGGKLASSKEQKVEVKTVENKSVIVIEPSDPQVIYVPSYNPTVVYGAPPPAYAYPPVTYPPYPTGAVAATAAVSFGVGVMMGAFWGGCCGGGGYGWGCSWGSVNNITINNNFNNRYGYASGGNRTNISGGNRTNISGGNRSSWQHNPQHRGAVPYSSRSTAQQFGGTARDASGRTQRFDSAGQRGQSDRSMDRGAQAGTRDLGSGRSSGAPGSTRDIGGGRDSREQASARDRSTSGGADRMGDRSVSRDSSRQSSAFSGAESRSRTQSYSDRGFSSSRSSGATRSAGGGGGSRSRGGGRRR
jgi:hypothetical protein